MADAPKNRFAGVTRTAPPVQLPARAVERPRKYTVLLDADLADSLDGVVLDLRRQVGRRVDRSEVFRELTAMLTDDPSLLPSLVERLRRTKA